MFVPEPHRYAGARALGALGAADAYRFGEHLDRCPVCGVQVRAFAGVAGQPAAYALRTPPGAVRLRWRTFT